MLRFFLPLLFLLACGGQGGSSLVKKRASSLSCKATLNYEMTGAKVYIFEARGEKRIYEPQTGQQISAAAKVSVDYDPSILSEIRCAEGDLPSDESEGAPFASWNPSGGSTLLKNEEIWSDGYGDQRCSRGDIVMEVSVREAPSAELYLQGNPMLMSCTGETVEGMLP